MKISKIILLLLLPLMAELVVSCCNCIEPLIQKYTNKSISVENLDNSGSGPVSSSSGSIDKNAYGIRIWLVREKTACIERRKSIFISSAFAYSCRCPEPNQFFPKDSISSVRIFTLNDFDSNHLSNAEITDYFKVYIPYSFTTISDFLKRPGAILFDESELSTQIDFLLITPPTINQKHQFRVQITLSDGRILEQITSIIALI